MFARFAPKEQREYDGMTGPAFVAFVWEVNTVRPDTFGAPENLPDTPRVGYVTEKYPDARIIHGPGDEGVRVVADSDESRDAFRVAARNLGIHLAGD